MSTFVINQDIDTTYYMSGDYNRYILSAGVTATSEDSMVLRGDTSAGMILEIQGTVRATAADTFAAVFMHGSYGNVEVHEGGAVTSATIGVRFYNSGTLENAGFVRGADIGVEMAGGDHTLTNSGTITSKSGLAVDFGKGNDTVVNTGRIRGDVDLGAGDDSFDFRGGKVDGKVFGGEGDDTYGVASRRISISEAVSGGFDRIVSELASRSARIWRG